MEKGLGSGFFYKIGTKGSQANAAKHSLDYAGSDWQKMVFGCVVEVGDSILLDFSIKRLI